jgi:signal transduction histidine kinase/ActR/RegA family two-component response regulator
VSLRVRLALATVGVGLLACGIGAWIAYRGAVDSVLPHVAESTRRHTAEIAARLDAIVSAAEADVRSAAGSALLVEAARAVADGRRDDPALARLGSLLAATLRAKPHYQQFRLIGSADDGREVVRADRRGDTVALVERDALQRKAARPYFQETIARPPGSVYVSAIELNREHGEIEVPHVPVTRVGIPVAAGDAVVGILIVNVDLRGVFAAARAPLYADGAVYVVDRNGAFLVHPDRAMEFAHEFGRTRVWRAELRALSDAWPDEIGAPRSVNDSSHPMFGAAMAPLRGIADLGGAVIETVPPSVLAEARAAVRRDTLLAFGPIVLVATLLALVLTASMTRPLAQLRDAVEGFHGERSSALPIRATGEVGALARAFEEMRGEIEDKIAALRAENAAREKAEAERGELEERLRRAQKMDALGRLAGGVAHDFNNVLTVILAEIDLALAPLDEQSHEAHALTAVRRAATRAADLTRRLLAFSRCQPSDHRAFELCARIREMEPLMRRLLGEPIELLFDFSPEPVTVLADAGQIEQVVMNLVVNARDAMPDGGVLTIEIKDVALDGLFTESRPELEPGPYAMIAVSDSGTGMSEEVQRRLFEPFFTTKAPGQGTGLGLATSYGIVSQHGGYIGAYSEPDIGTTFRVYLPRAQADAAPAAPAARPAAAVEGGDDTVLLVEDEPMVRDVTQRMLHTLGYQVLVAEDARTALGVLDGERGAGVHLLLSDLVLPDASGRVLAEQARARRPDLRVLYMSGYTADVALYKKLLEEGATPLQKPFTRADLAAAVRNAMR